MAATTTETFGSRLRQAIEKSDFSFRAFQREVSSRVTGGITYPTINSYLKDETEPRRDFIEAAAAILGVWGSWLAFGVGPRTDEEAASEERQIMERGIKLGSLTDHDEERAFAYLPDEEQRRHNDKRGAIRRFSDKLADATSAPFVDTEDRTHVLQGALRFLIGVEDLVKRIGQQNPDAPEDNLAFRMEHHRLYLISSASHGWRADWYDAVLGLYSRRVRGLGERSDEFWDQHAPAGGRGNVDYSVL
jgi:hypothetical protein